MRVIQQLEKTDVLTLIFAVEVPRGTNVDEVLSDVNEALEGDWEDWNVEPVELFGKQENERLHDVYVTDEEYDDWCAI